MTPDILVASLKSQPMLRNLGTTHRYRTSSFSSLVSGKVQPGQITIINAPSPRKLQDVDRLAARLKGKLAADNTNFVILSFDQTEGQEEKVRLLGAFDQLDRIEISDTPKMMASLLGNILAKIEVITHKTLIGTPRPSPLDSIHDVVQTTSFLREANGNLSAEKVAQLYGVSLAQLAGWLGRSRQTVARTPDADSIQDTLGYFERVARLLTVIPREEFRKWLRMPNPNLNQESPLAWIKSQRWQALADLVDDMLTGALT